jgi:hypothetical protein
MFRKIMGYFKYRKVIKNNLNTLNTRYKLKWDRLYGRLYTVLSIPEENQEVIKTYGPQYLNNEVEKYVSSLEQYFYEINLFELISLSKIERIDDVNVLVVLRYRFIGHQKFFYFISGLFGGIITALAITGIVKLVILLINLIMNF